MTTSNNPPTVNALAPTKVRYSILMLLCSLSMITYIDRAFWGSAQEDVRTALGLKTVADLAIALWAFQLAYALFEVPTGWIGDTFGPRKTLIRIVLWWSFFFCLTTLVGFDLGWIAMVGTTGLTLLVIFRFLFGIGEAGAYPNIARGLYNWFPVSQRGFAQGAVWMSARFMGGLTPLIWLCLVDRELLGMEWRTGFWIFGGIGILWCTVFSIWFRNTPQEHPSTNEAERELIAAHRGPEPSHAGVPWMKIITSRNLWFVCGMYVCTNYGWYFFMYFLPDFLKRQFSAKTETLSERIIMAIMAGGPLLVGVFGCLLGGYLTDRYVRRTGDRKWGRRRYGILGYSGCSAFYVVAILGAMSQNMYVFAGGVALAGFCNDLTMGASWATCQDIGRRYAAIVSGFMNMIGNLGAATSLFVTGAIMRSTVADKEAVPNAIASVTSVAAAGPNILQARESGLIEGYVLNLSLYALAYLIGVGFWLMIDASKPIVTEETSTPNH